MAKIKSALELALERTNDIVEDRDALFQKEQKEAGMRLVARYFDNPEEVDLGKELNNSDPKASQSMTEGILTLILQSIQLPNSRDQLENTLRYRPIAKALTRGSAVVDELYDQLDQLLSRYMDEQQQLIENVKSQLAPHIKAKEQQMEQQTGQKVTIQPERDPDFQRIIKQQVDQFNGQYKQYIDQVKSQIPSLFGL